ncbi:MULTISPECIES: ParB/RepB/Spo0J family partition protein [Alphaproteobacteria]|jgi:ParB family chromosome partitioning protein|uniref:ParB/RepB/Spo0J family partition protein n=3 Tax=cellular organisms TaxID=131567 RepID=A0A5P6P9S4_9BRAD|nr:MULTISPECIES: ParB/RepB/Spo0J family partition protein [Alphaproteobacteria]MCP4733668.1 ParB/RepB/Spo0J family partition protein [Bosea sp. (in: a-proteobacteria)]MBN8809264.1 ParB/RepB/Spo0J family partition protein [Sphingomonas sp.]MBR1037059.1 ParB/RepB/Spo0J family partition protein [Bradyrhizobium viridifuturi]MBR1074666.1 ParB/RepB/Spo0J family partition protein [Bradyrhizobium viridifuturi]MBR1208428.1 ParB/RepB/Spo0J family partition protein [Bradyrhizobium sp. AUGA SZCCT0124]
MAQAASKKITLSSSRDIPLNKLVLSQSNVRRVKAGVSIEELAEDIARRGLLQGLSVRPIVGEDGTETGIYEIPAGGRRFRALELLVKQKRLAKTAPVPCVVRDDGIAEEDSLAENVQRAPLHPLDQFRAFQALREKGQSEEDIAAAFFVPVAVVKQRLKLASVSPRLLDVYAEDGMTLDQLMAFTVSGDHERQEQVFERLTQGYDKQPYVIRRMLTEHAVRASDKRAQFVGIDAYVEAGGTVLRDLFQADDGGWLQDVSLLDMMVTEKLREAAAEVEAEGWKWTEVATSFPYGHVFGLRQLRGEEVPITEQEEAARAALQAELDGLEAEYAEADELPEEVDARLGEIETALEALDQRPVRFDVDEIGRAGAFVSIDAGGGLRIERGFVRPEDELPIEPEADSATGELTGDGEETRTVAAQVDDDGTAVQVGPVEEPEEDEGLKPIPDRLMAELTAHRTIALRHALGENPDVAFLAALHALCIRVFYRYALDTCLELDLKSAGFAAQAPGLADTPSARALDVRHQAWANTLPKEPEELWDALDGFDADSRQALFAHCVALSVNAVIEPYNRRPRAILHADRLAQAVDLDMAGAGWTPTVDGFLGRLTKARILAAVREAKGDRAGDRIEHMKKGDMAEAAAQILAGSGWLPEPLRTPGRAIGTVAAETADAGDAAITAPAPVETADTDVVEETAEDGGETAMGEFDPVDDDEEAEANVPHAVAAE